MDDNRHPVLVGGMENGAQSFDVLRVLDVHVRVGEVKLEASPQMRIVGEKRLAARRQ